MDQALDNPDGLLAAGGSLSIKRLVDAYRHGIFPWFNEGDPILWWSPDPRTVLRPSAVHISHSLRKKLRKNAFLVTIDRAFGRVLDGCAAPRSSGPSAGQLLPEQGRGTKMTASPAPEVTGAGGTWLSVPMRRAYTALHGAGMAHSIEVWMDGELAGGIYGVAIGRMFFGESMFTRRTDASKIGMVRLAAQLDRWQFPMIDCQLETEHLMSLGAEHMPRREFVAAVGRLVREPAPHWAMDEDLAGSLEHAPRTLQQQL
ncbi:MAG TPA: leucyl/phenylalanyl-tRNA--protein transferase [Vicinamibacterales bacterium]|nr:leucyl/phenylalanyl-tRNA--protein transferase [Vicinamibacterales bacterium]